MATIRMLTVISIVCALTILICKMGHAAEERLELLATDAETGTQFSLIVPKEGYTLAGTDPCKWGGHLHVVGEVPSSVSLANDQIAKSLIEKARQAIIQSCPNFAKGFDAPSRFDVLLVSDKYQEGLKDEYLEKLEYAIDMFKFAPAFKDLRYKYLKRVRKPEVYAAWYAKERREGLGKDPRIYFNEALERAERERFVQERIEAGICASKIRVRSIEELDRNSDYPRYSPDGSRILYSKRIIEEDKKGATREREVQVIKDVKTRETIRAFGKGGKGAWSPDAKKIAYFAAEKPSELTLHIFDLVSERTFDLGYSEPFSFFIVWPKEKEIYIVNTYYQRAIALDLETLKKTDLPKEIYWRFDFGEHTDKGWWFDSSGHRFCSIYQEDVKGKEASLIVANKDGSYRRALIKGLYHQHPYVISPDFTSVVFGKNILGGPGFELYIAYIETREEPIKAFKIQRSKFPDEFNEQLDAVLRQGVSVSGTVFAPRINPLNEKVVGPDEKAFKGEVSITKSRPSDFIAEAAFEYDPLCEGDVVTINNVWAVLEKRL